ncbi:MAG: ATP-binding protein [Pseudomonadales bacterium]
MQKATKKTQASAEKRHSFRYLLARNLTVTGLGLALVAALVYSILTSNVIKDFYEKEGLQATENFAQLSELALIYDNGDNGREAAIATLNFPSIKHVAIVNSENKIIFDEGETSEAILNQLSRDAWQDRTAKIVSKTSSTWQLAAPVFTDYEEEASDDILTGDEVLAEKYLGYVAIQVDAGKVKQVQYEIFLRNLVIGLIYGFAFFLVILASLRRLLEPMSKLASSMAASTDGGYASTEITPHASSEVHKISTAYNAMISALAERDHRLRSQKSLLETEVALQTGELVEARDAALEANRHKSEFLANITHELRTPLQSILGYTELLRETLDDEGLRGYEKDFEKITRNANHLLLLINSILDISKIEAGKMDINTRQTDLMQLLENAVSTVKPLVEKNNNTLNVTIETTKNILYADEQKIFQILLNLLGNAAKFTENGTIDVIVNAANSMLVIEVCDDGIGMSAEQQKLVFEPFRQVDAGENRQFVGSGLGLSIVLKLTEAMGGELHVYSEPGQGSRFRIELPLDAKAAQYQTEA